METVILTVFVPELPSVTCTEEGTIDMAGLLLDPSPAIAYWGRRKNSSKEKIKR